MSITTRLTLLDPTLKKFAEGFWHDESVKTPGGYQSFNDAGLECETGELLYAFTRILKPEHVLETGTHWGIGASYIGSALKDNQKGHLDTIEFLPEIHARAKERISKLSLTDHVTCHFGDARSFLPEPGIKYGLILLDTEPQTRFEELVRYFDFLEEGGYFFIHDLHRHMHQIPNEEHGFAWPFGEIPGAIRLWVKEGVLRPFHFPNPRGLTGFYKVANGDHKWMKQI